MSTEPQKGIVNELIENFIPWFPIFVCGYVLGAIFGIPIPS